MRTFDSVFNTSLTDLGRNLKELRKEKSLTQVELAVQSEMDERQIQRIENGYSSPTLRTLCKLAIALDVEVTRLLKAHKV